MQRRSFMAGVIAAVCAPFTPKKPGDDFSEVLDKWQDRLRIKQAKDGTFVRVSRPPVSGPGQRYTYAIQYNDGTVRVYTRDVPTLFPGEIKVSQLPNPADWDI